MVALTRVIKSQSRSRDVVMRRTFSTDPVELDRSANKLAQLLLKYAPQKKEV